MARKKPVISPFGQWAYPGEVTIIPSSDITMKGVNYPVLGIDNLGNQQMMMPGGEYTFPGDYVTEIPQMGKGGLRQWFAEEWTDVKTGKPCGRSGKDKDGRPYPACRPSKRVNETTPKTTSEMSSSEKAKFKREKTSGKRIDYNHKRREFGGESWLDQYQDGGTEQNPERMQGIDIKRKRKKVSDSPEYQYDSKGNLLYTPELNIYPFMSDNSSRDSFWVTPKIPIQNLNPTVEELRTVAAPYYPIDNKLVSDPKLTFKYSEAKPSNYQESLEQEYVLPQMVGKSFGNLPIVKDDGYSPNRRWITSLRNGDKLPTGYRNNSALYAYGPNNYAYVLKTDPNNLVNYPTKNKIENDLSLNDKALYDYLAKGNYTPDNIFGSTRELPDQIWNRAEQMRVEMRNNPEIMSWANLHNVDLGYKERYEDSEDNDDFAPKIPESIYAARLAKAGLPTNRPDYDYGDFETYIAQDPSKFNLVDYFPVDSFLKDAQNNPNNEKDEWGKVKDDQALKKQMAKRMGIDPSAFDSGEYLIHYNKTPITEYTPGKKYGGWLSKYQSGGLSMGDYDLTTAPKRGDYLLPDINRPSYIDEAGNKRSEYRMGVNIDGRETLIPTVVGGKQLSEDQALDRYYKTGLHMGQFNTPEEADYASRLRTARYNMLEDPIRFQADQFQVGGGMLPPIYTSNINDSRIRNYNDSLDLYNKNTLAAYNLLKKYPAFKLPKVENVYKKDPDNSGDLMHAPYLVGTEKYIDYGNYIRKNNATGIRKDNGNVNDVRNYDFNGRILQDENKIKPIGYQKVVENTETFDDYSNFFPVYKKPVQPIIYKPSLAVSNIDRDMYTPGGGMAREYNIGVTLQDGSKKAFRTEREYQDWKAANNLDISNAKVTEGKGYSYDYPENKKYGGWLDQYQDGSEVPSDIERMDAAVIKRDRSWLDKLKGYIHRGEKAIGLDPYNERPDDFMEQWARRINTATGGKDWYKQPNDASGPGGIGTAMMETVMAPFSAPQLASVYGATGKVQMPSEAMNIQNPVGSFLADAVLDPTNLVGAGIAKNLGKGSLQNMVRSRMRGARPNLQRSVDNIATPNISQSASISPVAWQAQELPGLHLKSTMTDGPISKIVEPKTGLVNVEQALGIIGKESGGIDKVALIKQGLGENIPKKMDYNDFRKTVQDQLIPLEKQFSTERSDYGINRLGYTPGKFVTKEVGGKKIHTYESDYLDNQTILFSNKDKFGRGSGAHGNPDETLGHAHYLIDKESPDVLTVTQIQSDAFQGTHRSMPKNIDDAVSKLNKTQANSDDVLELMGDEKEKFKSVFDIADKELQLDKATIENFTQKSLLDKNHQERYLQELVDYAGKQDYLNKVRVPTSETAAKVQGYKKQEQIISETYIPSKDDIPFEQWSDYDKEPSIMNRPETLAKYRKGNYDIKTESYYMPEQQTILKKYAEQPKTIKKLFGEEPKIVTDSKGNTWYEFDIPKKFKEGKGEIKAFSTIGGIGVAGAAASQLQEQRYGGWLNKYQVGGENLPELNSKIDIANFYKNPLSEKYSIYQDPEDNTYKYYKKSKETIPSKQNYISYTDQNKLMEDTLSEFPIIPPVWSEVLSSIPQEEKVNTITKPKTLPNKQSISKKTSTPQNQFSFDPNYWNDVNLQNEIFNRQLKDNKWYGSFDERGDNVLNRTDIKRNYDSEVFLQNMATPNSVIIDIGSALGNNNPKLAGVSVYELTSNPKIKSKNIKVIATDIPSEVKGFEELKKRNTVYPIDYTAVPETFNTPIRDILKNKKIESVKDVYLRAANSIDLLMNVQETAEHFKHISSTLKDKNVTYLYNNTILYKPAGSTKFKKLGNLNNSAFDHRSATWKNNTNRNHYTLLPTNENGGETGWLNKYK